MNAKVRRQLEARKRRIERRLDKTEFGGECPVISASNIDYEISERTQAIGAGGLRNVSIALRQLPLEFSVALLWLFGSSPLHWGTSPPDPLGFF